MSETAKDSKATGPDPLPSDATGPLPHRRVESEDESNGKK